MREPPPSASYWTSLPYAQFRRDPHYYVKHDSVFLVVAVAIVCGLHFSGYRPPATEFAWWHLALLPVGIYVMIMGHLFIHCASHGAWGTTTRGRVLNRVIGELCGALILTKFASWEIVHRRHHRCPDDPERDPHPAERGYWRFALNTVVKVERPLQREYFDVHGDTPERRRYERFRSIYSFSTGVVLAGAWFSLLGIPLFVVVYLPSMILAVLFVIHFNWTGHNAHPADGTITPTNLDSGWFWLGNRMFFGIYYHGNHHRMSTIFNPMTIPMRAADEHS